ncbi:MAG: phenylacetate-CoA [Actinobacteria bacterium]|nr:MAG: phenylacetate-CoA [Actinomycetota bacterium]
MGLLRGLRDFADLKRHARWQKERLAAYQRNELSALVRFAVENSPLYRELYAGRDLDDFAALPSIDKQLMMERFDDLNTAGLPADDLMEFALAQERSGDFSGYFDGRWVVGLSSGTSGGRGLVLTDRQVTERLPSVFAARSGVPLSLLPWRIVFMLRVFSQGFADIASPLVSITYVPTMTDPTEVVRRAREQRANILTAPPSVLRLLAPYADQLPRVQLLVSYAEVLDDHVAAEIRAAFGVPLIQIYQASEGAIACTCAHGNLHINEDLVYVELLDADGAPVTEPGVPCSEMLVTNLYNRAQPLIRYRMGDVITLGEPCSCGSAFRTIGRIIGRRDDVLWVPCGDKLKPLFPDLACRWIIAASGEIAEYRVEQHSPDALSIALQLPEDADRAAIEADVCDAFRERLAELGLGPVEVSVSTLEPGAITVGAKPKRFVRHFSQP